MNSPGGGTSSSFWFRILGIIAFICSAHCAEAQTRPRGAEVEAFFTAIQMGDTNAAAALLENNTNLPFAGEHSSKLPLLAAATGNIAALASSLETETNLEARNELGLTPLQVAVTKGHLAAAALLVDKGANRSVRDPDGNTLLHLMFLQDRFTVYDRPPASWLMALRDGPIKLACLTNLTVGRYEQGPNPVLQGTSFLLACGLDASATNNAGQTVMQLITEGKTSRSVFFFDDDREKLIKLLSSAGGKIDQRDADGNTALHRLANAVDANEVDRMKSLIAGGADVNATNQLGQTPLHKAAEKIGGWDMNEDGDNEPFQLLIKSGANVSVRDNQGRTPLDVLVAADTSFKSEATALLIKAGAKSNETDKKGLTPVHQALTGEWPWPSAGENLQQLAKAGADFSAKDNNGKTPLHYLAALGDQKPLFFIRGVDQLFMSAKVDFNARDNDGNTPLHIAAKTGTRDVFDWLVKQGAGLDETNNAGETPRLLAARASNGSSRTGPPNADTDIFAAAREGKLDSLSALIKADPALVNATDQFNQTPLRVAVMAHRTHVVEFLEQHGAKWDIVSAVMGGKTEVERDILSRQPEAIATKNFGSSLLHLAAANGDAATIEDSFGCQSGLARAGSPRVDRAGRSPFAKSAGRGSDIARMGSGREYIRRRVCGRRSHGHPTAKTR